MRRKRRGSGFWESLSADGKAALFNVECPELIGAPGRRDAMKESSDYDWAEGVRRSAEFMRLHHDEPNDATPRTYACAECTASCWEEDDSAAKCIGDCGNWLCEQHRPLCPDCQADATEPDATGASV